MSPLPPDRPRAPPSPVCARSPVASWLDDAKRPVGAPCFQVTLLLAFFMAQRWLGDRAWPLAEDDYFQPLLVTQLLGKPLALVALAAPMLAAALAWRQLAWRRLEARPYARSLVGVSAAILAWAFAGYATNPYFGHTHDLDRALLVSLAALVLWHPFFIAPLLAQATLLVHQFDYPLLLQSYTDKQVVFDVLNLFLALTYLRLLAPAVPTTRYLFIVLCLIASDYFLPGFAKVRILWFIEDDLFNLTLAAHDNGWLSWMGDEALAKLGAIAAWTNGPAKAYTLVVELGALAMLWRRGPAIALLVGQVLLHAGIFLASGILFWKWMLLDLTLVGCLIALPPADRGQVFSRSLLLLSLLLILSSGLTFRPKALGWLDTPLSTVFRVEAVGKSGQVYEVTPTGLKPYDFPLTQGRFFFLSARPELVNTYGSTRNRAVLHALKSASSAAEVEAVVHRMGKLRTDRAKAERMARFLRLSFANLSADPPMPKSVFAVLSPPAHKWTGPITDLPTFARQEPISSVRVREVATWLRREHREVVSDQVVLEVAIPERQ